jgi:hypothetical protein
VYVRRCTANTDHLKALGRDPKDRKAVPFKERRREMVVRISGTIFILVSGVQYIYR